MVKTLIVIVGPTAVGKTKVAIELASSLNTEIISADSRQFYADLKIGTAAPDSHDLALVKHHFVGHLGLADYYNVSSFEQDVLRLLNGQSLNSNIAVLVGGSGLYIDAVCKGIDEFPDADEVLRKQLKEELAVGGLEKFALKLKDLDPEYYEVVDRKNPNRILRAIEVCLATGVTYSSLRNNPDKNRPFRIVKIGLNRPREELFEIIHNRVDMMMKAGLLKEVEGLLEYRELNSLNTVGYKELFNFLDGTWTLELAIEKIKTNTRRYAKRQLTWFNRDKDIHWFLPEDLQGIQQFIQETLKSNKD